jgi:hypothetical protein
MTHRVLVVDDSVSMRDFIGTAIEEACGVDVDSPGENSSNGAPVCAAARFRVRKAAIPRGGFGDSIIQNKNESTMSAAARAGAEWPHTIPLQSVSMRDRQVCRVNPSRQKSRSYS